MGGGELFENFIGFDPHGRYDRFVHILYLTDRLSVRGGADLHLLQVIRWAVAAGNRVVVAFGRAETDVRLPTGSRGVRVRGLASKVESTQRLAQLSGLLCDADVVHLQNVMNPVALRDAAATGRAVATIQDHRVFCPGPGKTLPCGSGCEHAMSDDRCRACLPDDEYRARLVELTGARREALEDFRLVVLSKYMKRELDRVGLCGAEVIPPWVEVGDDPPDPGCGFLIGGRLVDHKGVIDGWSAWRTSACDSPLRVAGDGPLSDRVDGAEHLGWLSATALRGVLRRSRALVFPSRWQEPFGVIGVEALAEATPVIVAATGGTGEWSDAGCLRVAAGDVAEMAEAISRLDGDPGLARRFGIEGRIMVADRFRRAPIEGRLDRLYEAVAG